MSIRSVIEIRYAQIRSLDLSNGEGVGIALFVQGCHFHCPNCFNPGTWDFDGGKEWTEEVKNKFLKLANRPYIKRVSILGGEPLAEENLDGVLDLVNKIRLSCPQKSIWLYTGYILDDIYNYLYDKTWIPFNYYENVILANKKRLSNVKREKIISQCDVLVDGKYVETKRDITLKWRGSSNQRVIDIQKTLQEKRMVLRCN